MYFNRDEILKFYKVNESDKYEVIRLIDKIEKASRGHTIETTGFINPLLKRILIELLKSRDLNLDYLVSGGYEGAEYTNIVIFPDYLPVDEISLPLAVVSVKLNKFIIEIGHRDVLGSLMGLGISRNQIGDIIISDEEVLIICTDEISEFLLMNFNKIGSNKIKLSLKNLDAIEKSNEEMKVKVITVSSLRLDGIISNAFNISRKISLELLKKERVKFNYVISLSPIEEISEDDMISVRGYGRIKILSINGRTRKDRISIKIGIFS